MVDGPPSPEAGLPSRPPSLWSGWQLPSHSFGETSSSPRKEASQRGAIAVRLRHASGRHTPRVASAGQPSLVPTGLPGRPPSLRSKWHLSSHSFGETSLRSYLAELMPLPDAWQTAKAHTALLKRYGQVLRRKALIPKETLDPTVG